MSPHYFPLAPIFILGLFLLLLVAVALVEVGLLGYAYEKIGINRRYVFGMLAVSLLGSYVNIPVGRLPAERVVSDVIVTHWGVQYVVPVAHHVSSTLIAVNLGGAIVPTVVSLYLLIKNRLYWRALIGVAVVTVAVHLMAHPVRGVGIAVPTFVPPLIAAAVGYILSRPRAPALAYICGSLGTLIGADLLNLGRVSGLGAPVASIGGAGTFDGIFLTGVIAALIA